MNNGEDILKKILLNMRYDPRKSLKENKILLNEETCVPLDANLELYSGNHDLAKGKPKSLMYPELGTWGDGTCRCRENLKCLEYNKSCCKTGVVKVEPLYDVELKDESTFEQHTGIDGKVLSLPVNSQVKYSDDDEWWLDVPEVFDITNPDFQPVKTACSYLQKHKLLKDYGFTDIPSCILGYMKAIKTKSNQAGSFVVRSFKLPNGKIYGACYDFFETPISEAPLRPHEIKFSGYYSDNGIPDPIKGICGTLQYTPNEYKITEDPKAETPKFDTEKVVMGDKTVDLTKDFAIVF